MRGNKILWTKDSLGADMNILILKFTNKHQETDPYLLLAGIIGEEQSCHKPNRNTTPLQPVEDPCVNVSFITEGF